MDLFLHFLRCLIFITLPPNIFVSLVYSPSISIKKAPHPVVAIFLAAILMFVFPLMSISERTDDIAQLRVQTATVEYVDDVRTTGRVSRDEYESYLQTLASTGNTYDVDMEVKVLDENPGKKTSQTEQTKIGENIYYSMYTSQIEDEWNSRNGVMKLKEGDMVVVTVKNTNTTIAQMLKNFLYSITGNETYKISAQHTGVVMTNGSNN